MYYDDGLSSDESDDFVPTPISCTLRDDATGTTSPVQQEQDCSSAQDGSSAQHQSAEEGEGGEQFGAAQDAENWEAGLALPADNGRCSSALSNYSGDSSTWSSYRRRPASSLSSLHHHSSGSSKQLHELRLAAAQGRPDAVRRLLDAGVAVDQTLRQGWTPLMVAASSAQVQVVKLLLERSADPNMHKELFTPLMAACASSVRGSNTRSGMGDVTGPSEGDEAECGADCDSGESRLQSCVQLLLNHGSSVNAAERRKMTPLMFASKEGRLLLVRQLMKAGALPNMQDNKNWTALCWACSGGHGACARALLQAAADPALCTVHGQTAADIARGQHHYKLSEVVEAAALGSPITVPHGDLSPPEGGPSSLPPHCSDLDMVLAGLELGSLSNTFSQHKIDLVAFLRLTSTELSSLGINAVGVQHKLLTAIAEMHRKAWQPSSLEPLSTTPYISLIDATSMLGNVNKHVTFLEATIAFLRQQLESSPAAQHLHHNTTDTNITTLITTAEGAAASISRLHATTLYLSQHLHKLSGTSTHLPSDLIACSGRDAPRVWARTVGSAAVGAAVLLIVTWWWRPALLPSLFALAPHAETVLLDCA